MTVKWTTAKKLAVPVVMLLVAAGLNRWMHKSRAASAAAFRPIPRPLMGIPTQIGPFVSLGDVSLEPWVVDVLKVDTWVQRDYVAGTDQPPVQMYVGYWGRVNVGMHHGPEVCYPRAGWVPAGTPQKHVLTIPESVPGSPTTADVMVHHFTEPSPEGIKRVSVGFVAVLDGAYRTSTLGTFRHKVVSDPNNGFMTHVSLVTRVIGPDWDTADARILSMMESLLPHVSRCLFVPTSEGGTAGRVSATRKDP